MSGAAQVASRTLVWAYLAGFAAWRLVRSLPNRLLDRRPIGGGLATSPPRPADSRLARRPRVLLVHPYPILPPYHGGGVRNSNILARLADRCDLYAFVYSSVADDPYQRRELARWCRKVFVHRRDPVPPSEPWDLMPRGAQFLRFQQVAERLRDIVFAEAIDIVQLEYAEMGQYAKDLCGAKVVLTEHDVSFVSSLRRRRIGFHRRFGTDRDLWADSLSWLKLFRYELRVCEMSDQVHMMSATDAALLAPYVAGGRRRLRVLPNCVDTERFCPPDRLTSDPQVLFLGSFGHTPNLDAAEFLLQEIWPLVRLRVPAAQLSLVGAHPPDAVRAWHGRAGVTVVGTVADTVPQFQSHRLLAAPIRVGSGTRLKILEAFSCGLPVVSTRVGAEGIACEPGRHLLAADEPGELAEAMVQLLTDDELCARISRQGRLLAQERYDWNTMVDRLMDCYLELLEGGRAAPTPVAERLTSGAESAVDISIIIPTLHGGEKLTACLEAIRSQQVDRAYEIVCIDSGSAPEELGRMARFGARVLSIPPGDFNHGLTRDLGARSSRGRVLVFINQDAVPSDRLWLHRLTEPLLRAGRFAAIQGGIREFPSGVKRFYWDSCGERFYFTRESTRWIHEHRGIGFSTVNAALRREVWERQPFGWAPIMEDKKWQRRIVEAGFEIGSCPHATVFHTHDYDLGSLVRRCRSEGWGWRMLGERYRLRHAIKDMLQRRVLVDLRRGLRRRLVRTPAELLFPWVRPLALYWGNRWGRGVRLG